MATSVSRRIPIFRAALGAALVLWLGAGAAAAAERTRSIRQSFPAPAGGTVRLANLAGRVDLVPTGGNQVLVEVVVHADADDAAETEKLLAGMRWVKARDRKGREEWALSYPVQDYHAFHYPRTEKDSEVPAFLSFLGDLGHTSTTYLGEKVRIYGKRRSGAPTLYADLRIGMPAGAGLAVRNVVGDVRGGALSGDLSIDTGSGGVRLASHEGRLGVDTGSGDVKLGSVKGETSVDTGSGDIQVDRLVGNGDLDTGSGDVTVSAVAAGKLKIDTGSGDVHVRQGTAGRLLADTGSGDVEVLGVDLEELVADTGSGDVTVESPLGRARKVDIDTGSGDVRIAAGPGASFDLASSQGSGDLSVGYADATLRKDGKKVVGARRGDGHTIIRVETGSGDCTITPRARR
jgi:DUF4097 and DUF4098 domain-containing protein YvlB